MQKINYLICNLLWLISCLKDYFLLKQAWKNTEKTQKQTLQNNITKNTGSRYGKNHSFAHIKTINDFRKLVPIGNYESFSKAIACICDGEQNVLTSEDVLLLEPTSGSTGNKKFVPYTASLKNEFSRGINAWIAKLFLDHPQMLLGKCYWSITPATMSEKHTAGGVIVGFEDDSNYLGPIGRLLYRHMQIVPNCVSKLKSIDNFYYATLLFLLREKDLTFISVWNPSFLVLLFSNIRKWLPKLIKDIENGIITFPDKRVEPVKRQIEKWLTPHPERSREIVRIPLTPEIKFWPKLKLISCWGDGNAQEYLNSVRRLFPRTKIQPKGLISTEAFVSLPYKQDASLLSIRSHFFEFLEIDRQGNETGSIQLAHELELNKKYSVLVTTGSGFYRYSLGDIIQVTDFENTCPYIKFIGRTDNVSDRCGEKLNEVFVKKALDESFAQVGIRPGFYMLAPEKDAKCETYFYALFLELQNGGTNASVMSDLRNRIEARLQQNYHYAYCRKLKQLGPANIFMIKEDAVAAYLSVCQKNGLKLGNIKPVAMHKTTGWSKSFKGNFLS